MQIILRPPLGLKFSEITLDVKGTDTYDNVVKKLTYALDEQNYPLITTNPQISFNDIGTDKTPVELKMGQSLNDINVQTEQRGFFKEKFNVDENGKLVYQQAPKYHARRWGQWVNKLNPERKKIWESMSNHPVHATNPLPAYQLGKIDSNIFVGGNKKKKNTYQRSKRKVTKRKVTKRKVTKRKVYKRKGSKRKISKRRSLRIRRT